MTIITDEMIAAARKHDYDTRPRGDGGTWGSVPEPQVRRLLEGALARRSAELQIDSIASLFAFMSPGDAMATGAEFLAEAGAAVLERLGVKPVSKPDVSFESDDVVRITITWGTLAPGGTEPDILDFIDATVAQITPEHIEEHLRETLRRAAEVNNGRPAVWSDACAPGGVVCAVPDPSRPDGICGNPVESEPCGEHEEPPGA